MITLDVYSVVGLFVLATLLGVGIWRVRRDHSFDRHAERMLAMMRHPARPVLDCACRGTAVAEVMVHGTDRCIPQREWIA